MRNFSSILTRSTLRRRALIFSADPPISSRRRGWLFWILALGFSLMAHVGVAGAILFTWQRDFSPWRPVSPAEVVAQLIIETAPPRAPIEEEEARQGDAPTAAFVPEMEVAQITVETPVEPPDEIPPQEVAVNATPSAAALPDPDPLPLPEPEQRQEASLPPRDFGRPPPMRVLPTSLPFRDRATIEGRIRAEWARQLIARGLVRGPRFELELEVNVSLDGRLMYARVINSPALIRRHPELEPWIDALIAATRAAAPFSMSVVIAPNLIRVRDERTEVVLWRFWLVAR